MSGLALPLVTAFLAFLAGLLCGLRVETVPPGAALAALPLVLAIPFLPRVVATRTRPRAALALLLGALALAGAGHAAAARRDAAGDCRARLADRAKLSVRGVLGASFVPPAEPDGRIPLLPLRVEEVRSGGRVLRGCRVELRVRLTREAPAVAAGTTVEVQGEWWRMAPPVAPSRWPRTPAYAGFVFAREAKAVAAPSLLRHPLLALRGKTEERIARLFPRHAPLADALLMNRREYLDRELSARFAQSGLVHLLAISGTHVALLGGVLVLLGRVAGLPRDRVAWLTIVLMALYLTVIGAPPSAVRAGIMTALALLAGVLQRPSAPLPIVAAAALAILALDPMAALDAGFQLSFAGVLGILLLRPAMLRHLPEAWREGKVRSALADSVVVSLAAFVATAPIVAHHFGQVAPVSILANLPAIPLASLALVGVGAALALDLVLPPLAHLLADGAALMLDLLALVVDAAVRVPGGHAAVARPQWPLWGAAGLAFLLAFDLAGRMRSRVRWAVAGATACAAFLLLPVAAAPADGGLEIAFLDVGQGDAVAIRTPAGRWLLVDAGPKEETYDAGERRVLPYLRARGASRVEALVLTHPHADHVGGAAAVLRGMEVGRVVEPGLPFGSPVYAEVLQAVEEERVAWYAARQDRVLRVDGVELTFLWPTAESLDSPADANDISAVLHVRYGRFAALLTGDAPDAVEHALVERYGAKLRADVLKAGHHGSATSTSDELIRAVDPRLAVVSCGLRNRYGHPAPEAMARLEEAGVPVARTDRDGTVVVRVEPGGQAWARTDP